MKSADIFHPNASGSNFTEPLVINHLNDNILQLYELNTPFMILLETCHEKENLYSIYQFTQQSYQSSQIDDAELQCFLERPQHQHSFIEIMYVLSGSVTNHVENQTFTYEAGQCCIMNKNIRHKEDFTGDFQIVFLMLRDDFIMELLKEYQEYEREKNLPKPSNPIYQLVEDGQNEPLKFDKIYLDYFPMVSADDILGHLTPIFNSIIRETISREPGSAFFIKGYFSRLFHLLNNPGLFSINRVHSESGSQEFLFSKISHIMKVSHGRCTREDLSARLHYNSEYLNRIVKKYTGKTILEYGQAIYLEEARRMISDTDKSISAIIAEMGFSNRSHFYRLFEKAYGETPLDYRKRCL